MKAPLRIALLVFGVVLLASVPAFAQSLQRIAISDGGTIADLVRQMPRTAAGDGVRNKVIGVDAADSALLFPAAGSVHGSGGTYFHSDVTLINHRSVAQQIAIGWIAQGVDNRAAPLQYFNLTASTPYILNDFVAQTLGKSGLGAILVTGVTSTGAFDSSAQLSGFSRIWTPQPNATGTVSQGFPSVSSLDSLGSAFAYAAGLRHDSAYRSNVGIVNLDGVAHTWSVHVIGLVQSTSFNVTVLPYSMNQQPLPSGTWGDLLLEMQADGSGFWWSGYGASVDNITGDGWSSHALQP